MKWLVLNSDGERVWVDHQPIWRVDKNGKELGIGFLQDGTKVKKIPQSKKDKIKPSQYEYKRSRGRPRK
jgi:hypothetical protein